MMIMFVLSILIQAVYTFFRQVDNDSQLMMRLLNSEEKELENVIIGDYCFSRISIAKGISLGCSTREQEEYCKENNMNYFLVK